MDYFGKRDLIYIDLVSSKDAAGQMSMSADAEWFQDKYFPLEIYSKNVFKTQTNLNQ